jgi:hypothetical protein
MKKNKHIIIFSHGFGTKKDDRGLLSGPSGIAESIISGNLETILFDYNEIDEVNNKITVKPLSEQVKILEKVINEFREKNPEAVIDIIAHSQGCLVPAKLLPNGIRKTILLAPSFDVNNERMINLFKDNFNTSINLDGVSKLGRKDGTITIVPSLYWKDRQNMNPIFLYNEFSKITDLIIINANQDDIHSNLSIEGLAKNIKVLNINGDHNFDGEYRDYLIKIIKEIIL